MVTGQSLLGTVKVEKVEGDVWFLRVEGVGSFWGSGGRKAGFQEGEDWLEKGSLLPGFLISAGLCRLGEQSQ